ncbi:MAG: hypothetical protein DMD83_03235, partial [Candidatus Rokuibacteriota bacterium]
MGKTLARSALVLLLFLPAAAAAPALLVTVGEVTDTDAVLWVRGHSPGPIGVQYGVSGGPRRERAEIQVSLAGDFTGKLPLVALAPASRYRYTVSQGGSEVQGEFVTAPPAAAAASVRFVWSGDLGSRAQCRHVTEGYPIFRALARYG